MTEVSVPATPHGPSAYRDALLTAVAPCIWGSTYIVTTELLPGDRPLTAAAIRVLPVGLLLIAMTRSFPKGVWWWRLMLLGILNIGVFQALLFVAAYRLPGGVAATVGAVQPLVVVLLGGLMLKARHSSLTWLCATCGLAGVALLVLGPAARLDGLGISAALAGAVVMAFATVLSKRWPPPLSLLSFTGWQLAFGGAFLLPLAAGLEEGIHHLTLNHVVGYAYLALIGSGLTYALWFRGTGRLPAATVSLLLLLSPLVATLLGYLFLHQDLTALQGLGATLVLGSVWLGQRQIQRTS